jgi:hypothetical protein
LFKNNKKAYKEIAHSSTQICEHETSLISNYTALHVLRKLIAFDAGYLFIISYLGCTISTSRHIVLTALQGIIINVPVLSSKDNMDFSDACNIRDANQKKDASNN